MRAAVVILMVGLAQAQPPKQPAKKGGGPPLESVRPANSRRTRTAVAGLLGGKVGIRSTAFGQIAFLEAAVKTDAAGLAFIEGFSSQRVSPQVAKNLDANLSPDEIAGVRNKLRALNLKMPAYHVDAIPADEASRRRLFEFAKSLGADTIVAATDPAALGDLDRLANEIGINLAVEGRGTGLDARGKRIGASVEEPQPDALRKLDDRLMVIHLRSRGASLAEFLRKLEKLEPAPEEQPDKCSNCGRP